MPLYSYVCKECGAKFDLLVGVTSKKARIKCEKCQSKNVQKVLGCFRVGSPAKNRASGSICPTGTCSLG